MHTTKNHSDEQREKAFGRSRYLNGVAGLLFIILGLGELAFEIANKTVQQPFQIAAGVLLFGALTLFLYDARVRNKYKLAPQDEYEAQQESNARARGFEYLSGGIFIILILFPATLLPALVYVLFGASWIIVAGLNRDGKAATK